MRPLVTNLDFMITCNVWRHFQDQEEDVLRVVIFLKKWKISFLCGCTNTVESKMMEDTMQNGLSQTQAVFNDCREGVWAGTCGMLITMSLRDLTRARVLTMHAVVYFRLPYFSISSLCPWECALKELIRGCQMYCHRSPKPDVISIHLFTQSLSQHEKQLGAVRWHSN